MYCIKYLIPSFMHFICHVASLSSDGIVKSSGPIEQWVLCEHGLSQLEKAANCGCFFLDMKESAGTLRCTSRNWPSSAKTLMQFANTIEIKTKDGSTTV